MLDWCFVTRPYNATFVTQLADSPSAKSRARPAAQAGWTILILTTLYVCYFSHLGAIGFVGPDEPRYAWIARAMAQTADWLTPRLYGQPWFEKPPLYYWGAALSFKLFGVSETAARLPSAVCALLATLAISWLAWRIYGAETARWVLLLLPATVGMIGFSHAAAMDMPFSAMLMLAMVCAAVVLRLAPEQPLAAATNAFAMDPSESLSANAEAMNANASTMAAGASALPAPRNASSAISAQRREWTALIFFGVFLGLAVLAKGPAGVILCGGGVFLWALMTRRWTHTFRLLHPAAIVAFCAVSLPWYILCGRRNPDFFRVFIIEHNFKRYLTPEFQHIQPFWFYIPILFAALLPWSLGFVGLFSENAKPRRAGGHAATVDLFLLSFGIFPILFFSASHSKLPGYILPAVGPLVCLLAARLASALFSNGLAKWLAPAFFALTAEGIAFSLQRFAAHHQLGQRVLPALDFPQVFLPLLAAGAAAFVLAVIGRTAPSLILVQVGTLAAVFTLGGDLHWMDAQLSARGVLEQSSALRSAFPNENIFVHDVPRGILYGLNFYLGRELPEWKQGDAALGWVFTPPRKEDDLLKLGYQCPDYLVYPAAVLCAPSAEGLPRQPRSGRQP